MTWKTLKSLRSLWLRQKLRKDRWTRGGDTKMSVGRNLSVLNFFKLITHLITLLSCNYIYVSCPQVTVLLVSLWQPLFPERRSVVLVRIWFVHIFCNLFCDMSSFWLSINISKMEDQQFTRPQVPLVPQNINSRWWCWWYWGDFLDAHCQKQWASLGVKFWGKKKKKEKRPENDKILEGHGSSIGAHRRLVEGNGRSLRGFGMKSDFWILTSEF